MVSLQRSLAALVLAGSLVAPASALTLYNPALATLPAAQGWTTFGISAPAGTQSVSGALLQFSSQGNGSFGNFSTAPQALDTTAGFRLRWQLKIDSETHSDQRAGFSLLMQGANQAKSLELGFWSDKVWALDASGSLDQSLAYVRGETWDFNTTAALTTYELTVVSDRFSLSANGTPLFAGKLPLRDYLEFPFPNSRYVYGQSNFLFFGDNSGSGTSTAQIGQIHLLPVPEPSAALLLAAGLALVGWRARRR